MIMGLLRNENVLYSFRLMTKLFFYSVPFFYIFFLEGGGGYNVLSYEIGM